MISRNIQAHAALRLFAPALEERLGQVFDSRVEESESRETNGLLRPLRAATLADQCYVQLKDAILTLELLPGTPLSELQIANRLGISKSPVREAFQRLHGEGLVLLAPNRRCVVTGLDRREIREWYELRMMLEPLSLRQTLGGFDQAFLTELRATNHRAIEACDRQDPLGFIHYSDRFHLSLVERNPNRALVAFVQELFNKIRRMRIALYLHDQQHFEPSFTLEGLNQHERIIDCLSNGDSDGAVEGLTKDLASFIDKLDQGRFDSLLERVQFRKVATVQSDLRREGVGPSGS
jgi:DNA-binding GntR family transcriptional regulator